MISILKDLKKHVPWWLKIIAKIFLSRLPIEYKIWRKVHLFKLGSMDSVESAYSIFIRHYHLVNIKHNFTCLELGPGDSLFSALIARALGSKKTFLVDIGDYADHNMELYKSMYGFLLKRGYNFKVDMTSLENMLSSCQAVYMTSGITSLREITDDSADMIFSQAVLEHVKKRDFLPTLRELCRILRPGGCCSHEVDLKDHLGGSLNNLRFSDRLWESDLFARSRFYTNRIRFDEMLLFFKKAGFRIQLVDQDNWACLPIKKCKLNSSFRELSEHNLCTAGFRVILKHDN